MPIILDYTENFDALLIHKESLLNDRYSILEAMNDLLNGVSAENMKEGVFGATSKTNGIAFGADPSTDKSYLQSRNFITGTTGWQILSDGTAQFASITLVGVSGLVVGTNVGLGTAQDSAGVTTIIGNTVTTGYVNALSVVAGSVAAENITGTTITGKTIKTSGAGDEVVLSASGALADYLLFYHTSVLEGNIYATAAGLVIYSSPTAHSIILGNTADGVFVTFTGTSALFSRNITFTSTQTVDGVDISVFAASVVNHVADANAHHAQTHTHDSHSSIGASDHHSSTSNALAITPSSISMSGDIDLNSSDVTDVKYLKFNSTYGRIYWGTNLPIDMYTAGGTWTKLVCQADFVPNADGSGQLGYNDVRWDKIHADNMYCTNQTANKFITGDLHFKDLFRIDEDPKFLNFYNKKGQRIMRLSQSGVLYVKKIKEIS